MTETFLIESIEACKEQIFAESQQRRVEERKERIRRGLTPRAPASQQQSIVTLPSASGALGGGPPDGAQSLQGSLQPLSAEAALAPEEQPLQGQMMMVPLAPQQERAQPPAPRPPPQYALPAPAPGAPEEASLATADGPLPPG